ncbi:hypothetical protein FEM33_07395 [Dyadobacter flavalbus]|uniref:Uncharacterized protein n=1 Tax=Dyadobacter flavalbus TaxID=2579942 RepID=A0A5M8R145_9BACT|nr:hypothetical protein [Dyadobacter flavalbus]KAA6440413.1 hypothetical protein FEM33_07395 [Dyadobacter flavalbus]
MKNYLRLSGLSMKTLILSAMLFAGSCTKENEQLPQPETSSTDAGSRTSLLLPSNSGNMQDFKISTKGMQQLLIPPYTDPDFFVGSIDKVSTVKQKVEFGFIVSSRTNDSQPINPVPLLKADPLVRKYIVSVSNGTALMQARTYKIYRTFSCKEVYYRTYMKFENNAVIYGEVMHTICNKWQPETTAWNVVNRVKTFDVLKAQVTDVGSSPAVEHGFVISYKQEAIGSIHKEPTLTNDTKLVVKTNYAPGEYLKQDEFSYLLNFPYTEIYYRPYVKTQDGFVRYGDVKHDVR